MLLAACLFFIVVGSRWAVVNRYGMDLPEWDQWDAEGTVVLKPWLQHSLTVGAFFRPHNEHRVVLTKLLNFGLTVANGQWDQQLEAAVNALFPGALAAVFFLFGCRTLRPAWHAPLFLLLTAVYALPLAWQNVLGGFHSQQFFLIGLSLGAIAGLTLAKVWTRNWWLGAACAVLALGSMASGFFAAAVVTVWVTFRLLRGEMGWRAAGPTLALCLALVAVGWSTRVPVDYHEFLKARNAGDFATSMLYSLQWPAFGTLWAAVIVWLPWGWLSCLLLVGKEVKSRDRGCLLTAVGLWVILQIVATAYARGAGGAPPASRYLDTLIVGLVVNGVAIGWLWQQEMARRWSRPALAALGLGWAASFAVGVTVAAEHSFGDLGPLRSYHYYCEQNTRNFLLTGDEAYLHHVEIPYPGTSAYLERLRVLELQTILPAGVRAPIALFGIGRGSGFVRYDSRHPVPSPPGFSPATPPLTNTVTWGSFGAHAIASWESAPLRISRPGWLVFEIAGQAGTPGVSLELRDASTRDLLLSVRPRKVPNDSWRSVYVPAPAGPFVLVARTENPLSWLAFSEPIEMKTLSYWAWRGVQKGLEIATLAAAAALVLGFMTWRRERILP